MRRLLFVLACATVLSSPALALTEPRPVDPAEPRVRAVEYVPDQVVKIAVPLGDSAHVIFSAEENGTIVVSRAQKEWIYNRSENGLVFVPNPGATTTLAHVDTALPNGKVRHYTIELSVVGMPSGIAVASADGAIPPAQQGYGVVRYTYAAADRQAKAEAAVAARKIAVEQWRSRAASRPPVVRAEAQTVSRRRCDFMWRGDATVLPQAACDQGTSTQFLWAGQVEVPSLFTVSADGREQAVTAAPDPSRHGLMVVPQTAQRWLIRSGRSVAELFNVAYDPLWNDPVPGSDAQATRQASAR